MKALCANVRFLPVTATYNYALYHYTVFSECDENPCQNEGICQRHVLDYTCTCPSTHTGNFCETGNLIECSMNGI